MPKTTRARGFTGLFASSSWSLPASPPNVLNSVPPVCTAPAYFFFRLDTRMHYVSFESWHHPHTDVPLSYLFIIRVMLKCTGVKLAGRTRSAEKEGGQSLTL
jgi:hypothetical protein